MREIQKYELRSGWLGLHEQFKPLDLLGAALGSYFIYQGVTNKGPDWLTITLGALMLFIHTQRFFLAPEDKEGLIRLLNSLDVSPQDLENIKAKLNAPYV